MKGAFIWIAFYTASVLLIGLAVFWIAMKRIEEDSEES